MLNNYITSLKTAMVQLVLFLLLSWSTLGSCHSDYGLTNLFTEETFPAFLTELSLANLSELCRNQTRGLAGELNLGALTVEDLNNGFWNLKSKVLVDLTSLCL